MALLEAFGVEVIVCPTNVPADDPRSYYKVAERIRDEQGAYLPYQYYNQANPEAHYRSTGPEIWRQTDGTLTHWVAGIGTGGTISGTAKYLKERNPRSGSSRSTRWAASTPTTRSTASCRRPSRSTSTSIDGIGEDFLPATVWWDYIDEVVTVDDKSAYRATQEVARKEGIFCGSSAGAAAEAARRIAQGLPDGALVVTLFPDSGERYLSKLNEEWLQQHDLLDEETGKSIPRGR